MLSKKSKVLLTLISSIAFIFMGFHFFSHRCHLSHVEKINLDVSFDYILIKDMSDLESSNLIAKDTKLYRDVEAYINEGAGFVFLTNGYKIEGCNYYRGMMYIYSERTSPEIFYAAYFKGELKGPYKFANPA